MGRTFDFSDDDGREQITSFDVQPNEPAEQSEQITARLYNKLWKCWLSEVRTFANDEELDSTNEKYAELYRNTLEFRVQ